MLYFLLIFMDLKKGSLMKKIVKLLTISLFFLNTAHADAQKNDCCSLNKGAQETTCFFSGECAQEFLKGFAAGAIAGGSVDFLRNHVLPDITSWNLYGDYGVCRDQFTGEAKVAAAALGVAALSKQHYSKFKLMGAQLVGIIVGACAASYATKLLTPAVAPVTPAPVQ